jgi:hypothetical protein
MNWMILTADEYRHIFSVLIGELLLVLPAIQKKNFFLLRLGLCIAVSLLLCPLYSLFYFVFYDYLGFIAIVWYALIAFIAGAAIKICFQINWTSLFWVMLAAYAAEHFVYVAVIEVGFIGIANDSVNFWIQLSVFIVVCSLIYYLYYRLFNRNIRYLENLYLRDTLKNRLLYALFFLVFFASTMLNQLNAVSTSVNFNYLSAVSDIINCLFIIIVQYIGLTTSKINVEKQLSEKILEDEKRQYANFKNSVEYVNIKCHDLKHELAVLKNGGSFARDKIEEIANGLTLYDAFAKTGNETLDIILTEKNLSCIANNITFSYIADASSLRFMEESDIYTMFGNLLNNAIEHVSKIEDKEKRVIRMFIKPRGNMVIIHQENYNIAPPKFENGIPVTTKGDTHYHGYGIKSMKSTARKYGGDLRISTEDNMFRVDIFLTNQ